MRNDPRVHAQAELPAAVLVLSRALADPMRVAILSRIRERGDQSVADLTKSFGLHHSAIRTHLKVLTAAGLITRSMAPARRPGRPPQLFRAVPGVLEKWGEPGPHQHMSDLLLDMVVTGREAQDSGRAAGVEWGERQAQTDPLDRLVAVTRAFGFEPETPQPHGTGLDIRLQACPFAAGARKAQAVICGLHRGLAEGVLATGSGWTLADLVIAEPGAGGCALVLAQG